MLFDYGFCWKPLSPISFNHDKDIFLCQMSPFRPMPYVIWEWFFLYRKVHLFLFFLLFRRSTRFDCITICFQNYPILHIFLLEVKYVVLLTLVSHPVISSRPRFHNRFHFICTNIKCVSGVYKTRKELSSKLTKGTS